MNLSTPRGALQCACIEPVRNAPASLPADLAAAHAMILAERSARQQAEALVSAATLEIERLKLLLAPRGSVDPRRFADGSAKADGAARAVRADQRARQAAHRPTRAPAGRDRGSRRRGRGGRGSCYRHGRCSPSPAEAGTPAAACASAARAVGRAGADDVPMLRGPPARQDRRGDYRDPRRRPTPLVCAADRAREVHLPGLRAAL